MGRKQKEKRTGRGNAAKPVAPIKYRFVMNAQIEKDGVVIAAQSPCVNIWLPCSLADLTNEVANAAFSACEELAFKAGIKFIEEKPLDVCICPTEANPNCPIHGIKDEDIPF